MKIESNSRQIPTNSIYVANRDYCDLLYAWLQCNSERISPNSSGRRIDKKKVKWQAIERDFTRMGDDGKPEKVMARKAIAKYFSHLENEGLIKLEEDGYYYLTVLPQDSAYLIEYNTLVKMMNVLQKRSISVYVYLFNRYYASGFQPFIATIPQIKEYVGYTTLTTSNNSFVNDTLDILQRLGLLGVNYKYEDGKTYLEFKWVKNKLPDLE